ncbi:glycoside hydrolase family 127 protein [Sphingomonas sp. KR1UV-12]|uniref:Glycoside hydrolase family 127 protein n=1 Tax=Sphingomonas aurea TaxID=3063994 RepID=A0ABT9ELA4_9SPHN|nr:beta-L-arabinofuranosidase domain-containing protein [Sphingomonas sp. KR1UV-12]MDP1027752.1 glycoside hydrolase family 127 protein [Sphingomonas sp. KR1UV-12]
MSGKAAFPVGGLHRRQMLKAAAGATAVTLADNGLARAAEPPARVNLAKVAVPAGGYVSGDTRLGALNSGAEPANSADTASGAFGTWPRTDRQWVSYEWSAPVRTDSVDIYWWQDGQGIALPRTARLLYWNGSDFVPVRNPRGGGLAADRFNRIGFDPVTTTRLKLEMQGDGEKSVGILQWRVWNVGPVPVFAPAVVAGVDRSMVMGGQTYLAGKADWLQRGAGDGVRWTKVSGPGEVIFADPAAPATKAAANRPGDYVLRLSANAGAKASTADVALRVVAPPPAKRLDVVYTTPYAINSPLWNERAKALIVNWIPHCIAYCERTDLKTGQGGLDNFVEAGKALRGEAHAPHKGYVFSNAWVHQTMESMCIALMVDPQGDADIAQAQAHMRATLARWIPVILAAQEPDGYLHTAYTLAQRRDWPERWSPEHRGDHEGYVAGYFIESAINHHTLTGGSDLRLYDAAKKLADCWVANIGPGKKPWFDGHQEMEQALVRFGRFVNDVEGGGRGDAYIRLARFLLDSREGGSEYDQSHLPPEQQYEAVGHAVRAVYFYSGMADIAAETGDRDYQSATMSLWDNMVNRKYYVTGGVGSGDTSEGFGGNYALRNDAYCESCSSCGLIFFQYKLNLSYHDAKYADLYEETMYNALLGATDLAGKSFCYTNPLENTERAKWHTCPCCVGNIPRTLLMMPTWTYVKDAGGVYVNLFVGSRIDVGEVAGTRLQMVQETDYPWKGAVAITVNPAETRRFAVRVRVPDRRTSALYTAEPAVAGLLSLKVNGKRMTPQLENGYAVITREWRRGDRIEVELPMAVQRVTADKRVDATRNKVALRFGPLVYNVERADQARIDQPLSNATLTPEWRPDLLGGVTVIRGTWADGSPMLAIPNFARANRDGGGIKEFPGEPSGVEYAPGALAADGDASAQVASAEPRQHTRTTRSQVWIATG